jgi:hypothetical protein
METKMAPKQLLDFDEVLNIIKGLTRDKLNYWIDEGYIPVVIEQRSNQNYKFIEEQYIPMISSAYYHIVEVGLPEEVAWGYVRTYLDPNIKFSD